MEAAHHDNHSKTGKFYDFRLNEKGQRIMATFGEKVCAEPAYFIFRK